MESALDEAPVVHIATGRRSCSYSEIINRISEVEKVGGWLARSTIFGSITESQGCVLAIDLMLTGSQVFEFAKRNKLVNGKPFMQYDAMLATFRERGGESNILEWTPEIATIELKSDKKLVKRSLTWEDLKKEPVVYSGKEDVIVAALAAGQTPTLKPKYATPLSRKTMLLARLVSATMRAEFPEIAFGLYTPEEIEDFTESDQDRSPSKFEKAVSVVLTVDEQKRATVTEDKKAETPAPAATSAPVTGPALEAQTTRIKELMAEVAAAGESDIADRVKKKLASHGLARLADLSIAEADLMIQSLATRNVKLWFEASLTGHASSPQ